MRMALLFLAACSGGHSPQGQVHGECNPDGTCDVGLVCVDNRCTALDGFSPPGDSIKGDGSMCADDSTLEPNDTIQTAFATPVDTQAASISLAGLAICPATDKDHFRVTLSATKAISATAMAGAPVNLALLNAGGTAIDIGGGQNASLCAPSLPAGTYFVQVQATAQTNYRLDLAAKASCP